MELIRISESKLKVMLSAEDMHRYALSCDTIESPDSPSRRAFWSILDEAKRQTGFDTAGGKVYVQLYPERGGGCEMFVTKLGSASGAREEHRVPGVRTAVMQPENSPETERVYLFSTLADLLAACRRMQSDGSVTVSRAYVEDSRRRFYLTTDRDVSYLTEYNAVPGGRRERTYMLEHARCFCRDAAAVLGELL